MGLPIAWLFLRKMDTGVSGTKALQILIKTKVYFCQYFAIIFLLCRYIESGVYSGITEEVLAPKLQNLLEIPDEKLLLWNLYTVSDFKVERSKSPATGSNVFKFFVCFGNKLLESRNGTSANFFADAAEQYRRYMKGNSNSVQKLFSSLKSKFDHLHVICHIFRDTPSPSANQEEQLVRYVHDCFIVCTIAMAKKHARLLL